MTAAWDSRSLFRIPLKATVDVNLSEIILQQLKCCERFLDPPFFDQMCKEAAKLNGLREKVTKEKAQLHDFEEYLLALECIADKFDLSEQCFAWSECRDPQHLIQARGIWYEYINVAFNLAAKYTHCITNDSQAFQRAAGMILFAESWVLPKLQADEVPTELSSQTLNLLSKLCLARANELIEEDFGFKWVASEQLSHILQSLESSFASSSSSSVFLHTLKADIASLIKDLQSNACFLWGEKLSKSRKRKDQLLAKAALHQCCLLSDETDDLHKAARKILNEPRGRRKVESLETLDGQCSFEPTQYFSKPLGCTPISWCMSTQLKKTYFKDLLPVKIISLPYLLQHKLTSLVHEKLGNQLMHYNRLIRQQSIKLSIPTGVEILQQPTRIPQNLLTLSHQIIQAGGVHALEKQFEQAYKVINEIQACVPQLAPYDANLIKELLDKARMSLRTAKERFESVKYLLKILENGEEALGLYLKVSSSSKTNVFEQRTKPAFLAKVEIAHKSNLEKAQKRDTRRKSIILEAQNYDFKSIVSERYSSLSSIDELENLDELINYALKSFKNDFKYLDEVKLETNKQLRELLELNKQFRSLLRQLLGNTERINSGNSLATAWSYWVDTSHDVEQILQSLSDLKFSITCEPTQTPQLELMDPPSRNLEYNIDSKDMQPSFVWHPGLIIKFK